MGSQRADGREDGGCVETMRVIDVCAELCRADDGSHMTMWHVSLSDDRGSPYCVVAETRALAPNDGEWMGFEHRLLDTAPGTVVRVEDGTDHRGIAGAVRAALRLDRRG